MTSRISSGSSRCDSSVEPTRSMNITVSCRRSASRSGGADTGADTELTGDMVSSSSAAIAARTLRRGPTGRPSSLRSSSVRCRSASKSTSFAVNASMYLSSPRRASQEAMSGMIIYLAVRNVSRRSRDGQQHSIPLFTTSPLTRQQQVTGTPGSPSATTTIDGRYVQNPPPAFGGEKRFGAEQMKAYVWGLAPDSGLTIENSAVASARGTGKPAPTPAGKAVQDCLRSSLETPPAGPLYRALRLQSLNGHMAYIE